MPDQDQRNLSALPLWPVGDDDVSENELLYWLAEPCNCTAGRPTEDGIVDAHTCFHHRAQVELDRREGLRKTWTG